MSEFICRRCGTLRLTDSSASIVEGNIESIEAAPEEQPETGLVRMQPSCPCGCDEFKHRDENLPALSEDVEELWELLDQLTDDILPKLDDIDRKTTWLREVQEAVHGEVDA